MKQQPGHLDLLTTSTVIITSRGFLWRPRKRGGSHSTLYTLNKRNKQKNWWFSQQQRKKKKKNNRQPLLLLCLAAVWFLLSFEFFASCSFPFNGRKLHAPGETCAGRGFLFCFLFFFLLFVDRLRRTDRHFRHALHSPPMLRSVMNRHRSFASWWRWHGSSFSVHLNSIRLNVFSSVHYDFGKRKSQKVSCLGSLFDIFLVVKRPPCTL